MTLSENRIHCAEYLNNLVTQWKIEEKKGLKMFNRIMTMDMVKINVLHRALIIKDSEKVMLIDEIRHKILLAKVKWELSMLIDLTRSLNPHLTNVCVDTSLFTNKILWSN